MMDLTKYAKALAEVRKTGKVNMFDRRGVFNELTYLGSYEEACFLWESPLEIYLECLSMSGEY